MAELRVLYVNQAGQVSGAERSLLTLLDGLRGTVKPIVACPPGELADELAAAGIETEPIAGTAASFRLHPMYTGRGLLDIGRSAVQVRRLVSRVKPDLVHANTTRAALLALLARRRSGPPVIAHIRDWTPPGAFPDFVLATIERGAEAVVANSGYVAERFRGSRLARPVRVVYNPVDLSQFDPAKADGVALREELEIPASAVVLSVIGQIAPLKGQDDAIRAAAALVRSGLDARLLIVGSVKFASSGARLDNAGFGERLPALASELGLGDAVRFLGERSDVAGILAATDVLLMPFWQEGFGRVAVEAMAMGVPVLACDVGGPAEIVRPGVDGLLLPPRDPEAWSRALGRLIPDDGLRRQMGANAQLRAAEFGIDEHVKGILALYRELAE
jgi:glycosyltransferase involved in cell wall biosynthesis